MKLILQAYSQSKEEKEILFVSVEDIENILVGESKLNFCPKCKHNYEHQLQHLLLYDYLREKALKHGKEAVQTVTKMIKHII